MKNGLFLALFATAVCAYAPGNAQDHTARVRDVPAPATIDVNGQRPQDAYMMPWKQIPENNIAWKKRVWRNIDLKDLQNAPFIYNAEIGREHNLAAFMVQGAANGAYKAYSAVNDRFTTELTAKELTMLSAGMFDPMKVAGYRIKEDWLYLKEEHRTVVRIVGIAPLMEVKDEKGVASMQPAFWVYYPDARPYFAGREVYNSGARTGMNWVELFERGNFRGRADKTTDTKTGSSETE